MQSEKYENAPDPVVLWPLWPLLCAPSSGGGGLAHSPQWHGEEAHTFRLLQVWSHPSEMETATKDQPAPAHRPRIDSLSVAPELDRLRLKL